MSRALLSVCVVLNLGLALGGCASNPPSAEAVVIERGGAPARAPAPASEVVMLDRDLGGGPEAYRGPLIAAMVTGSGPSADLNRRMASALAGTDVFATVLPIGAVGEAHEAEVIILPTVLASGPDRVQVRVKTWRKGSGASGMEKVYEGKAGGGKDALTNAMLALSQDLGRRYGARAAL